MGFDVLFSRKPEENAGFADSGITNDQKLGEIVEIVIDV